MEVDFPRGGVKGKPVHAAAVEGSSEPQKRKPARTERKVPKNKKRKTEESNESGPKIFDKYIKYDILDEEVRGIGAVAKIEADHILLQTINGIRVKVPVKNISRVYQQTFSKTHATLDDIFKIGQMLAFRVETPKSNKSKEIIVSTCPSRVNDFLNATTLLNGIVCNATVKSIEEKGAVMDLGFEAKLQGFAPHDLLPDVENLLVGQVLLVRIIRDKNDNQRFIKVSAFPEMETFEEEKMTMNHLTPGTVLNAEPSIVKNDGVVVNFKNGLQAFVPREQLPPRIRADLSKLVRTFRVVVVLCRQNSPLLVVSGHPDVVALSKYERRQIPKEFSTGSLFEGQVYAVDKNNNVFFSIPEDDGKVSLVTAKLMGKNMEDTEKIQKFAPGSTHKLRVLKASIFERSLLVTNKKSLMDKSATLQQEFEPGQHVTFVVKSITDIGMRGTIGLHTRATISLNHILDLPVASWQKAFKEGQKIKCRVLYKNEEKHAYALTAKPALVNSHDEIISAYDKEMVDKIAVGLCVKLLDTGAIITFYNKVQAFLPDSEVQKIAGLKPGLAVKGRILMVDPEKERMTIVIGEKNADSKKNKKEKKAQKPVKNLGVYTAKLKGPWIYGGTIEETTVMIELPHDNVGRLHVSEMGKNMSAKKLIKQYKNKSINVRVIAVKKITHLPLSFRKKFKADIDAERFYECTFDPKKLNEPKKKHRLFQYQLKFSIGDTVTAYLINSKDSKIQKAEVNPIFKAQINPESGECIANEVADEHGITRAIPVLLGDGEPIQGKVTSINSSQRSKVLRIDLDKPSKVSLEAGDKTYARVISVSRKPFCANLALPSGGNGILSASGASEKQLSATKLYQYIKSDDLLAIKCLTKNDLDWIVADVNKEELHEYNNGHWSKDRLYYGYVIALKGNKHVTVEVYPGVHIAIEKLDRHISIDDLIVFKVIDAKNNIPSFNVVDVIREVEPKAESKAAEEAESEEDQGEESDDEAEDEEEVDESDIEMVGADDENAEMKAVKNAMAKLSKGGDIFKASAFTKDKLITAKKSLQAEATKKGSNKRERIESLSSLKSADDEEDDADAGGDDTSRILHKEKVLSGLEKSLDLNDDADYNRLVLSNPHSSEAWISYMIYQAQDDNVAEARKVAENALNTIDPRGEQERLNMYTAYLNLEVASGDEKSLKAVFERAINAFDSFEVHKRLANIYLTTKKYDDLEKLYNVMIKKFGNHTRDVWNLYGTYLYKADRRDEGRDLMKRALKIIPKKHHMELVCRFANLEYAHGDLERGKTMLEKAVAAAPNRGDLWNVYIDKAIKYQSVEDARLLFERAMDSKLGMHTIKNLLQKWQDFEKLRGDEEHLLKVNERINELITPNKKKDSITTSIDGEAEEEIIE